MVQERLLFRIYFSHWTGDLQGDRSPAKIFIDDDKTISAYFNNEYSWEADINIVGSDFGVPNEDKITIGVMPKEYTIAESLLDPAYSCRMLIYNQNFDSLSTDIRQEGDAQYKWIIAINPHGNVGDPLTEASSTLSWDPISFGNKGIFQLKKGIEETGETVISDMRKITGYQISGYDSFQLFTLQWVIDSYTFDLEKGWNLISLPLEPEDNELESLFPEAKVAYAFENGSYVQVTKLEPGTGYWINLSSSNTYTIFGHNYSFPAKKLNPGWHLMGSSFINSIPKTDPDGIINVIYRYSEGSYEMVDELEPGFGYWIGVDEECELSLD